MALVASRADTDFIIIALVQERGERRALEARGRGVAGSEDDP